MSRVLCVEDKQEIAAQVAEYFTSWKKDNPYGQLEAVVETSFNEAIRRLAFERFDLVTLDLHSEKDPDPDSGDKNSQSQEGRRVLEQIKKTLFVPVIFYSGYADKIEDLRSPVVKIVKKGEDDLEQIRRAATEIYQTGLPKLVKHIEEEQRSYIWDTVDKHWSNFSADWNPEEFSYLLARRLAARFNREGIKELLGHDREGCRPIEFYIYPPVAGEIKSGFIYDQKDGHFWIVATPSCDFALKKADQILLVGATLLSEDGRLQDWKKFKWVPGDKEDEKNKNPQKTYNKLRALITNNAGERYRYLPGTFFIPDLVLDAQTLRQVTKEQLPEFKHLCTLDSPYKEEIALHFSKYYGRLGTPDLELPIVLNRLKNS